VEIGFEVLKMWRSGVLIMDEVDLILHPLKSELNFPVGRREPLDLTHNKGRPGARALRQHVRRFGLTRAQVCAGKSRCTCWTRCSSPWRAACPCPSRRRAKPKSCSARSRWAPSATRDACGACAGAERAALRAQDVIEKGCEEQLLQKAPHLVRPRRDGVRPRSQTP
jgi:hypothetical protein